MPVDDGLTGAFRTVPDQAPATMAASHGLDGLNLFVANIQTGFGPFIAVYLITQGWTQTAIGVALSLGTLTAMASQIPAGALVDAIRAKSMVALASILAFAASALLFALSPTPLSVYVAEILHGFSSCTLGPVIAALSLAIAGNGLLGQRLGRNARFASIGNGVGAALMGACGYYVSERGVFFLTAILTLPALAALVPLRRFDRAVAPAAKPALPMPGSAPAGRPIRQLLTDRRLLMFGASAMLFTFANAALLPLASATVTKRATGEASLLIAGCIILPQLIVAVISPTVGRLAERRGRRFILLIAFAALTARAFLFGIVTDPILLVAVQALDGVAGACFGVMVPLITSDIAGRSGHFNLCLGLIGFTIGIGATLSTTLAGLVADQFGDVLAFLGFGVIGAGATLLVLFAMPETRPEPVKPLAA
jgi:MFS family permease